MSNFIKKQYYIFSPITFLTAFYAYQAILAPYFYLQLVPETIDINAYTQGLVISLLYLGAIFLGWMFSPKFGSRFSNTLLNFSCLSYNAKTTVYKSRKISILFFCLFVVSFVLLAVFSGAGILWITNSRLSYQFYRNGVGGFYAAACTFLRLSYTVLIFNDYNKKKYLLGLIVKTVFFIFFSYFLGSKGMILSLVITALVYYNYYVAAIKWQGLLSSFILILTCFSLLQFLQGTADDINETILYADYFHNTSEFIRRFDEFGFQWGQVFLSNFWSLVPRGLYPDKPYEYGQLLINEVLFPGLAEKSFTPGLLPWAADYLDFGIVGVCLSGIFKGLSLGWAHEYFLNKNKSITGFIILLQVGGLAEVFSFTPMPLFLIFAMPILSFIFYIFGNLNQVKNT